MNATEAINNIKELLGLKLKKETFYTTVLVDGETTVTNNLDKDSFEVGETLYVVGESTLSPAPEGEHETREGLKITLDEESIIVKLEEKTEEVEEVVEEEAKKEEEVMSEEENVELAEEHNFQDELIQLKSAMAEMLELVKTMNEKFNTDITSIKTDFDTFKNSPERKPVEKKAEFKETFDEFRVKFLKDLRSQL